MKTDRLLSIVILLINHKKIQAKKLADRFEVSVRTIHRDMEAINLAGIPVISYQGSNGGYGIMEGYNLDRQLVSMNDIFSIITALKGFNTIMDPVIVKKKPFHVTGIQVRTNNTLEMNGKGKIAHLWQRFLNENLLNMFPDMEIYISTRPAV